jgi:hypothetical protein
VQPALLVQPALPVLKAWQWLTALNLDPKSDGPPLERNIQAVHTTVPHEIPSSVDQID